MKDLDSALRQKRLKVTPARVAVLEKLTALDKPASVADLQKTCREFDLATIYRTIETLQGAGLVKEIKLSTEYATYELAGGHDHHHITCVKCGRIDDFVGCDAKSLIAKALKQTKNFSSVQDHSLELFGVCKTCKS